MLIRPMRMVSPAPNLLPTEQEQFVSKTTSDLLLFKFPDLGADTTQSSSRHSRSDTNYYGCFHNVMTMMMLWGSKQSSSSSSLASSSNTDDPEMGVSTQYLPAQSNGRPFSSASSTHQRLDSFDARTPLNPSCLRPVKPKFKRRGQALHSLADKIVGRLVQGASKYRASMYKKANRLPSSNPQPHIKDLL